MTNNQTIALNPAQTLALRTALRGIVSQNDVEAVNLVTKVLAAKLSTPEPKPDQMDAQVLKTMNRLRSILTIALQDFTLISHNVILQKGGIYAS